MSAGNKQDKQIAVSKAVLEIIDKEGILGVTHSKASRKSKVSRPWIYEYIGKEKSDLIDFAASELATYFTRLDLTDLPSTKDALLRQIEEGTNFLFETAIENPTLINLYYRFRGQPGPLGEVIEKFESLWIQRATESIIESLALTKDQAKQFVELGLILRLGYAHRICSSKDPLEKKEEALEVFRVMKSFLNCPP